MGLKTSSGKEYSQKNNELKKKQFSNRFESALVSIRWV
jgi:ribosomal protein L29